MKYFIDFEASQYRQEIIQIGCVREDGKTFNSLVQPRKLKHITKLITELTGLTRDMFVQAKTSDEVFSEFFDWILTDKTPAKFYCYGNADIVFVKNNLNKCTRNFKAQAALSMIAANLTDVTTLVEEHFRLRNAPSLKKVMDYYFPDDEHICHDALSDAEMLANVYKAMRKEKEIRGIPFPDHIGTPMFKSIEDFDRFNIVSRDNQGHRELFNTFEDAKTYLIEYAKKQRVDLPPATAQRKIVNAINAQKSYFGLLWMAEVKRNAASK